MNPSSKYQLLFNLFLFYTTLYQFSFAIDTLTQGQSLKDGGQTLLSSSKIFELGFFSPGNSTNRYIGIWYHDMPTRTIVWVANREAPLTNSNGTLGFEKYGNLALITDQGNILWSTNALMSSNSSVSAAQIMDTGELVLQSNETAIWSNFDHPTDTFVPGMKVSLDRKTGERSLFRSWKSPNDPSIGEYTLGLDPSGSGQLFIWKGKRRGGGQGQWDGTRFIGSTMRPMYLYGFKQHVDSAQGLMYITFTGFNNSLLRFVMQMDGVEHTSIWAEATKSWESVWVQPINECETYAKCRNNGICNDGIGPMCKCLQGFEPKIAHEWNNRNWSSGCVRKTQLQCESNRSSSSSTTNGNGDGFYKYQGVKVPDLAEWASIVVNEEDCRNTCTRNCSCKAYAFNSGIGCLTWGRDLIDTYQFSVPDSGSDLYIKLAGSELGSIPKSNTWRTILVICASAVVFIVIICILLLWWKFNTLIKVWLRKDEKKNSSIGSVRSIGQGKLEFSGPIEYGENEGKDGELPLFNFDVIANSTNNFSDLNKLGEGGFGGVYKGTLFGGREIAVKKLSRGSGQGQEEFKNELTLIAKLQHRNLVKLLGWCCQGEEKLLIYEYMPNRSLDSFLFGASRQALDWNKRFSIIEGIARGIVYLHRDSRLRIVHRDLKASNILLDEDMNPKISDFGMARIFGSDQNQLNTNRVVGTFGYMSPEYAMEGLFSVKSDVYSFGILVLEIISGRRNNSFHHMPNTLNIVGYAWKLWDKNRAMELVDQAIVGSYSVPQVVRCIQIGLLCVQDRASDRPDMPNVVLMLGSESATLPLPKAPLFTMEKSPIEGESELYSVNDVTITELLAR